MLGNNNNNNNNANYNNYMQFLHRWCSILVELKRLIHVHIITSTPGKLVQCILSSQLSEELAYMYMESL